MNNVTTEAEMEVLREHLNDLILKEADYADILRVSVLLDKLITSHYCDFKFLSLKLPN